MTDRSTSAAHGANARVSLKREPWFQTAPNSSSLGIQPMDATRFVGTTPIIAGPQLQSGQVKKPNKAQPRR